jgi:1,2-diacylglycerol 3-beta-galactosyltransferase
MILHPRFYGQGGDRARAGVRREMGIPPPSFTTLLLFGGKGSAEIPPLASSLLEEDPSFHVIAVCGENPSLFGRLGELESRSGGRLKRLGFTDRIAELMAASDVVVTKPGPGTLAEAFHQRVPVVVTFDERTIPQECFNARFVDDKGLGLVVHEVRLAPAAAARIARDNDLREALHRSLASLPPNRGGGRQGRLSVDADAMMVGWPNCRVSTPSCSTAAWIPSSGRWTPSSRRVGS